MCISKSIHQLANDFCKYPNKYLTEDDVRFHLCYLLMNDFGKIEETKDNDCSISLHTEIRWWSNKRLKYRSDIVLLDVGETEVTKERMLQLNQQGNHPQKGYAVNKVKGVIEIKFRRNMGDSDNQFLKKIKNDYKKLKNIKNESGSDNENIFYSLVILDKKQDMSRKLTDLSDDENIKLTYKFANLTRNNC